MGVLEMMDCRCHVKLRCTAALRGLCGISPQVILPGSVILSCMNFLVSAVGVSRINTARFFFFLHANILILFSNLKTLLRM